MTRSTAPGTADQPTSARDNYGATGTFHGPVNFGGHPSISWPHRVGVVPPVAIGRLERPADTALETAAAAGSTTAVVYQVVAGFGGVGKTQLAATLAHRWWQEHRVDLLIWVTATSRTAVITRYAQAAADVTGVEDPDPRDGAQRLLAWLAGTTRAWLLVLDDLTDPTDLQGLWPPVTTSGRTVLTTRRRDSALLDGRVLIDVGPFTATEAVDYLHGKLGNHPHRLDEAEDLAADLGRLPLALAQAAVYIADQDLTCSAYRRRLHRRRLRTLRPPTLPDDQHTAVADTWGLSIDLANAATGGLAEILLQLTALLDPNGIPARLFATTAVTRYCTAQAGQPVGDDDTHDALRALHRLSLITVAPTDSNGDVIRVHSLLQRVVREDVPADHEQDLALAAADAIDEAWPAREPHATTAQWFRANTIILHRHTAARLWTASGARHPVLFRVGTSLGNTGLPAAAFEYYNRLHLTATGLLGADHPDTLATRSNVASWQGHAGDPAGAAAAFEQLLPDQLRVLGPDHPGILTTRTALTNWRGRAGDPAGAAAALQQLLPDQLRMLGPDHPDTLATRANLANFRGNAGDPAAAAAALGQLLEERMRILGPDHPHSLSTRNDLAYWTGLAGNPAGAAAQLRRLVEDRLRVLGPDHPDTFTSRNNFAYWLGEAGNPAEAITALRHLLEDRLRVSGPDDPGTLQTRHNLARKLGDAGDPAAAAAALEQVLADRLRVLGPDHPRTLHARHHLAYWRGEAGEPTSAVTSYQQLLVDRRRVLGPDHPQTLTTRHHLAHYQGLTGDPVGAAGAFEQLLTDQIRVLGPDNPDTMRTRKDLARSHGSSGDADKAVAAYRQLLDDQLRVLDRNHPHLLSTRGDLAHWQGKAGDPAGAAAALEQLLTDSLRILGTDHPYLLATRGALAYWQSRSATQLR
ncbi:tetratricopeptide repeat protein [Actinoplanes sp. L3-i22]|uniref:tetratricopeptide repeat protein n=1 Tax=Actinoplanes sp. L3-i22 TaxID=2836373 RepID=UPI001C757CDF|nr:tetratricopeptide repeat protein [Actinoplanes sp. L3-i22]BCY11520.1 ATP-binding protein [Actinoplanes sp. L3-i22]